MPEPPKFSVTLPSDSSEIPSLPRSNSAASVQRPIVPNPPSPPQSNLMRTGLGQEGVSALANATDQRPSENPSVPVAVGVVERWERFAHSSSSSRSLAHARSPTMSANPDSAAPMPSRDRQFWVTLAIWAAIPVCAVVAGVGAFLAGSPHSGFVISAAGLLAAYLVTLLAF